MESWWKEVTATYSSVETEMETAQQRDWYQEYGVPRLEELEKWTTARLLAFKKRVRISDDPDAEFSSDWLAQQPVVDPNTLVVVRKLLDG
jgi:hypothetical protein